MIIRLTKEQIRLLVEETRKKYPIEACGLLFGCLIGEEAIIREIVAVHNTLESPTNFQIDPETFSRILFEAEKEGLQLIGFFHSHPAIAHPSKTDIRFMKFWPKTVWLVISSIDYSMVAYKLVNGEPLRISIKIKNKD